MIREDNMISVIVPFKDAAPWLPKCVNSLRQQAGDFEFLFVNDGSTDGGDTLIPFDDRFILIDNEHKPGVSGARNTGIDHATGEWITFLDADDFMLPNAYKIFMRAVRDDERANIHQFNHRRYYALSDKTAFKYANDGGVYSLEHLPKVWFGIWNKLYRADFLNDVYFNEKLIYGEDGLFVLACLVKDNYIHHALREAATVTHCFVNKNSLSKHRDEKLLFKYVREMESFLRKQKDPIVRQTICQIMSDEWKSKRFMQIIGLREPKR